MLTYSWLNQDCRDGLRDQLPGSVDLTVTSPPYGTLRRFGGGRTFSWSEFTEVAEQLFRVTRVGGVVCWQVADQWIKGSLTDAPMHQLLHFRHVGFLHYETLVISTTGQRPRGRHYDEPPVYVWVLSRGRPDTVNLLTRPNKKAGSPAGVSFRQPDGSTKKLPTIAIRERGKRTTTWQYHPSSHIETAYRCHPATMHGDLATDLILSYSRRGDLVCDPFGGVATTGSAALRIGRRFVGWEIHAPYHGLGSRRLEEAQRDRDRYLLGYQ